MLAHPNPDDPMRFDLAQLYKLSALSHRIHAYYHACSTDPCDLSRETHLPDPDPTAYNRAARAHTQKYAIAMDTDLYEYYTMLFCKERKEKLP